MGELTVIIPFLNENIKVEKTLKSIRDTAKNEVEILLINDASYDKYEYERIAREYNALYILNKKRKGVAASRDLGVQKIQTKYFLIIDAHMEFYNNNWWKIIIEILKKDPRQLLCCKCRPLNSSYELIPDKPSYGAYINMNVKKNSLFFQPEWIRKDPYPDMEHNEIPCVLGASYAAEKEYWEYLKGLNGLETYGLDEPYISLKVWLEGGKCILLKNVEIGHVFEDEFNYSVSKGDMVYNCLLILETLFSEHYKGQIYNILYKHTNPAVKSGIDKINLDKSKIEELKNYYLKISNRSLTTVIAYNERVRKYNSKG